MAEPLTRECEVCQGSGKVVWESQRMTCGGCGGDGEVPAEVEHENGVEG